jgi:two-component system cell cycle sensor histidine kinase/response regulator CckA
VKIIKSQSAQEFVHGGNETVLLVEDDPLMRVSVRTYLLKLGYCVLEASNGVEALEAWKHNNAEIHLLLTDLVMPGGVSGMELAERILSMYPNLKVIYVSGYSAEVAGKDIPLEEGVNFLTKPFQSQKLAQTIRSILDS